MGSIGRCLVDFPCQLGKTQGQRLQLIWFLRYDTGKRALVADKFILGTKAFPVRHQPDGLGGEDSHLIDGLVHQELSLGSLGTHALHEKLCKGFPVFMIVCKGHPALSALDIIIQIDKFVILFASHIN